VNFSFKKAEPRFRRSVGNLVPAGGKEFFELAAVEPHSAAIRASI
jgi:hypothetical protein